MADGIGRLSGYGNYGVGGYMPQRRGDVSKEDCIVMKIIERSNNYYGRF